MIQTQTSEVEVILANLIPLHISYSSHVTNFIHCSLGSRTPIITEGLTTASLTFHLAELSSHADFQCEKNPSCLALTAFRRLLPCAAILGIFWWTCQNLRSSQRFVAKRLPSFLPTSSLNTTTYSSEIVLVAWASPTRGAMTQKWQLRYCTDGSRYLCDTLSRQQRLHWTETRPKPLSY